MTNDTTMNGASAEMPRYQSHKKVWALRIAAIEIDGDGTARIAPKDEGYAPFKTVEGWADRFHGSEEDLGVYVVYEDGYTSWSPAAAFDSGYTRVK